MLTLKFVFGWTELTLINSFTFSRENDHCEEGEGWSFANKESEI